MRKVKILTDSTCDIIEFDGQNGLEKFGFDFIPLYVNLDNNVYKDAVTTTVKDILDYSEEHNTLPKTAAASVDDYVNFFKKYIDEDYDIIFMGIGSKLSSGYQSALIASQEFEEGRIHIIDTNCLSSATGLYVLRSCMLANEGKSADEIITFLNSISGKNMCSFVIDSLDYLYKGGRCSGMAFAIGSLLRIKPLISLENGELIVASKALGKRASLMNMVNNFKKDFDEGKVVDDYILLTHTLATEDVPFLIEQLVKIGVKKENIHESIAGSVIASHCGRKTIGIIYTKK